VVVAAYGSPNAGSRASKEAFIAATKVSLMSLCTYARELAMHAWPELVTMPWVHHRTAFSMLASGNTMLGLLPPSSRVTRFRLLAAVIWAIFLPVPTLPLKEILRIPM
jgi:hypothetical protein